MKKSALLLASAVMFAGQIINAASASASSVDSNGGTYVYVPEAIESGQAIEAEIKEYCSSQTLHNYETCVVLQSIPYYNDGTYLYSSYKNLWNKTFAITAVNPFRSTIRAFYGGYNNAHPDTAANVDRFFVYWTDDDSVFINNEHVDQIINDMVPDGVHLVLSVDNAREELFKTGEETRFVLPQGSLINNEKSFLFAILINDAGDILTGNFDYNHRCVYSESELFGEGKECTGAFYNINNTYTYYLVPNTETEIDATLPIGLPELNELTEITDEEPTGPIDSPEPAPGSIEPDPELSEPESEILEPEIEVDENETSMPEEHDSGLAEDKSEPTPVFESTQKPEAIPEPEPEIAVLSDVPEPKESETVPESKIKDSEINLELTTPEPEIDQSIDQETEEPELISYSGGYGGKEKDISVPQAGSKEEPDPEYAESDYVGLTITLLISSILLIIWWIFPIKHKKHNKKH